MGLTGRTAVVAIAVAVTAAACASSTESTSAAGSSAAAASALPRVSAATLDGGQLDVGALEGQDLVLWFWAPW